jgi:hypothetical protein
MANGQWPMANRRYTLVMRIVARAGLALLLCFPLTGCYVKTYGVQSTGSGLASTTTGTQVGGSAGFAGGRASFSSGRVPPPGTSGGHLYLGKGASVVLVTGVVIADFFSRVAGRFQSRPLAADAKILETCSCYKKEVISDR